MEEWSRQWIRLDTCILAGGGIYGSDGTPNVTKSRIFYGFCHTGFRSFDRRKCSEKSGSNSYNNYRAVRIIEARRYPTPPNRLSTSLKLGFMSSDTSSFSCLAVCQRMFAVSLLQLRSSCLKYPADPQHCQFFVVWLISYELLWIE
jgi:hypothetical protein